MRFGMEDLRIPNQVGWLGKNMDITMIALLNLCICEMIKAIMLKYKYLFMHSSCPLFH